MPQEDSYIREIEEQAVELAQGAGDILLHSFQRPLAVEYKDQKHKQDPVTSADRQCEAYLKEEVAHRFPHHAIVGEEGAGKGTEAAQFTWLVDPLDGTVNFLNGLPIYACSICVLDGGTPVAAAVFLPWPGLSGGKVLHARIHGGAWDGPQSLKVAEEESPTHTRLAALAGQLRWQCHLRRALRHNLGEPRSPGTISYELALVAAGTFQYGLFAAPQAWDVAAGILLVQEAGGLVLTRVKGQRSWQPFRSFAFPGQSGFPTPDDLRGWRAPIIAGNPQVAQFVARGLSPRRHPLARLLRYLRRAQGTR